MKPVLAEDMRRLDRAAIEEFGIPGLILMENAGRGVSDIISRAYQPGPVAIFVGKGNNGGDGLVVSRYLTNRGFDVLVLLLEEPARLKSDPLINYRIAEKMKIPVRKISGPVLPDEIAGICSDADLIVDAIFGVGLNTGLAGVFRTAVEAINHSGRPVLSIDIPSGLDADSGAVHGAAVKASTTATLGLPKAGLMAGQGPEYSGKIEIVDIGIPRSLLGPYLD